MNFLSHFYFERFATNPERIVGGLLPDLLKNADKTFVLKPRQYENELLDNPLLEQLYIGWNRHIEVDRLFHNSTYFFHHTHQLKLQIQSSLQGLPIRPSFMAHIALELLLDHILTQQRAVSIDKLYGAMSQVNEDAVRKFLKINQLSDIPKFDRFYHQFIEWKYLYDYAHMEKIAGALFNICKRLWQFEVQENQRQLLTEQLVSYLHHHMGDYQEIYQYIHYELVDFK
ncbi:MULTISPECIES: ACP phosphodiesterase [Sphingobacterium]|uniref:DUF479 domain-containing protein n=1 Tax=Sphingobacterium athyrii TaxID=2152717 RepID=A0A363NL16_9SPHI|nr:MULTISPECIES: hypothetical protein [Sphingobacterium]PUV21331.1 hypothetical protein DCO56_26295 [Sphingobacterium athyrii]QIH36200.1 hypothetical protein G6053_26460 [Sphingobacterium sp. DR205]